MTRDDFKNFSSRWSATTELQGGKALSDAAIKQAFMLLATFDIEEIKTALVTHCRQSEWIPKPANIIAIIQGKIPDAATQYGLAEDASTPLGAFLYQTIGSFDMSRMYERDAVNKVKAKTELVADFVERAQLGRFYDNEIRLMIGRGIDPCDSLCHGLPGVRMPFREKVKERANRLTVRKLTGADSVNQPDSEPSEADKAAAKEAMEKISAVFNEVPAA